MADIKDPVAAPAVHAHNHLQYVGPQPPPMIRNLPNTTGGVFADKLNAAQRKFVIETVPDAKDWWK